MRISIKSDRIRLYFWLPLCAIKSRLAGMILTKSVTSHSAKSKNDKNGDECHASETPLPKTDDVVCPAETSQECSTSSTLAATSEMKEEIDLEDFTRLETEAEEGIEIESNFVVDRKLSKSIYYALKHVVKECGHFALVDVASEDGNAKVKIII